MKNFEKKTALQLRIYTEERDRINGEPAYDVILKTALDMEISGATVFRGLAGYGCHHQIHRAQLITLSDNLPMVVEIIDTQEKVEKLIKYIDLNFPAGVFTLNKVEIFTKQVC